jgi:hypothetical protein
MLAGEHHDVNIARRAILATLLRAHGGRMTTVSPAGKAARMTAKQFYDVAHPPFPGRRRTRSRLRSV